MAPHIFYGVRGFYLKMRTVTEIIIREGHLFRETTTVEPITWDQTVFNQVTTPSGQFIRGVFGPDLHWARAEGQTSEFSVVSEMSSVTIDTYYRQYETPEERIIIVPTYADNNDSLRLSLTFQFPTSGKLDHSLDPVDVKNYFITTFDKYNINFRCLMVTKVASDLYLPPFPNIHDDGSFCMGDWYNEGQGDLSPKEIHLKAKEYINNSVPNTDLYNIGRCNLCRYEDLGDKIIQEPLDVAEFVKKSQIISTKELSWMSQL